MGWDAWGYDAQRGLLWWRSRIFDLDKINCCNLLNIIESKMDDIFVLILHDHKKTIIRQHVKPSAAIKPQLQCFLIDDILYFESADSCLLLVDRIHSLLRMAFSWNNILNNFRDTGSLYFCDVIPFLPERINRHIWNQVYQVVGIQVLIGMSLWLINYQSGVIVQLLNLWHEFQRKRSLLSVSEEVRSGQVFTWVLVLLGESAEGSQRKGFIDVESHVWWFVGSASAFVEMCLMQDHQG